MRVAYADPPYIGEAWNYPEKQEVDHQKLISDLCSNYDGWALSCHTPSLKILLPMCPGNVRVAAWVKPFCSFKPNVNPAYAWEPVLFIPSRGGNRDIDTVRDWLACSIALKKGMVGAKPARFCFWLFDLLGLELEDEFDDLYPGTGVVTQCLEAWRDRQRVKQLELEVVSA